MDRTPTVELLPLPVEAFPAFLEIAVAEYASENVASGRWLARDALALARGETEQLLPQGHATPGHFFYRIAADGMAEPVGNLWLATLQRGTTKVAYVYQVVVNPEHRRRGYARRALEAAETLAIAGGHGAMVLNVFAHNEGARALYEALGYRVTNMNMAKPLTSHGA